MTSVFLVGNCHYYTMRRSLQFFDSALRVEGCHVLDLARQFSNIERFLEVVSEFDHVVTTGFTRSALEGLSTETIQAHHPRATVYPTVSFGAFHPDVVYVLGRLDSDDVLASPLGVFHSALVVYGFRRGFDAVRTTALFRADIYQRLGFFTHWSTALEEMCSSPESKAFGLRQMALGWLRQGCFMHNPQHPKVGPIVAIARETLARIGLAARHEDPAPYLPDDLLISHIWPVYPEIASFYGVPGSYTFKRQSGLARWPEFMTLEEFVLASYECYRSANWTGYVCPRVDGWLAAGLDL